MIFQTEKQLKDYGDKLSDDKKKPIEEALEGLKKAHESKDLSAIDLLWRLSIQLGLLLLKKM